MGVVVAGRARLLDAGPRRTSTGLFDRGVNAGESELDGTRRHLHQCHSSYEGPFHDRRDGDERVARRHELRRRRERHRRDHRRRRMRIELVTNGNGNFRLDHLAGHEPVPYSAEVSRNGVVSKMLSTRARGENDCNSCHTPTGLSAAPGRNRRALTGREPLTTDRQPRRDLDDVLARADAYCEHRPDRDPGPRIGDEHEVDHRPDRGENFGNAAAGLRCAAPVPERPRRLRKRPWVEAFRRAIDGTSVAFNTGIPCMLHATRSRVAGSVPRLKQSGRRVNPASASPPRDPSLCAPSVCVEPTRRHGFVMLCEGGTRKAHTVTSQARDH